MLDDGRVGRVQTVEFVLSRLDGNPAANDLGNALTGISGVASITVDIPSHTVSVEYDPALVSPTKVKSSIEGAGYPIDRVNESEQ